MSLCLNVRRFLVIFHNVSAAEQAHFYKCAPQQATILDYPHLTERNWFEHITDNEVSLEMIENNGNCRQRGREAKEKRNYALHALDGRTKKVTCLFTEKPPRITSPFFLSSSRQTYSFHKVESWNEKQMSLTKEEKISDMTVKRWLSPYLHPSLIKLWVWCSSVMI